MKVFIGGAARNMHSEALRKESPQREQKGKVIVQGLLERVGTSEHWSC